MKSLEGLDAVAQKAADEVGRVVELQGLVIEDLTKQLRRWETFAYSESGDGKRIDDEAFASLCEFTRLCKERERKRVKLEKAREAIRAKGKDGGTK